MSSTYVVRVHLTGGQSIDSVQVAEKDGSATVEAFENAVIAGRITFQPLATGHKSYAVIRIAQIAAVELVWLGSQGEA